MYLLYFESIIRVLSCSEEDRLGVQVRVGYHRLDRLNGTEKTFTVEKIILHEKYDSEEIDRDIALLKLKGNMMYVPNDKHSCSYIC